MHRTLIIIDGRMSSAERMAGKLACLIGNSLTVGIDDAPEDLSPYDGICFIFNFYGAVTAGKTRSFLMRRREELSGRRIVFIGVGFSDYGYTGFVADAEQASGIRGITGVFIASEEETARVGYEIGRLLKEPLSPMEPQELLERIESFIACHSTMALATSGEGYVRCTPVEYHYIDGAFYLITEGGLKFRGIFETGNVAAAIYDTYMSFDNIHSLQLQGKAEVIAQGSQEYFRIMDLNGISEETIASLPVSMFMVKISPMRYEFFDSGFEEDGCDVCQILETEFMRELRESGAEYASAVSRSEMTNEEAARMLKKRLEAAGDEEVPEEGTESSAESAEWEETEPGAETVDEDDESVEERASEEDGESADGTDSGFDTLYEEELTAGPDEVSDEDQPAAADETPGEEPAYEEETGYEGGTILRKAELSGADESVSEEESESGDSELTADTGSGEISGDTPVSEPDIDGLPTLAPSVTPEGPEEGSFRLPSFMKPYIDNGGQIQEDRTAPLPEIDMSVLDGIGPGRRHRFDDEEKYGAASKVRQKAVTFLEPEIEPDDLAGEFDEDDSPVLETASPEGENDASSKAGKRKEKRKKKKDVKGTDAESGKDSGTKRRPKSGRTSGILSRIGKAINRMLLIDDLENDDFEEEEEESD